MRTGFRVRVTRAFLLRTARGSVVHLHAASIRCRCAFRMESYRCSTSRRSRRHGHENPVNPEILSKSDADNRQYRARLAPGPISHRRLVGVLLCTFCRSCVHDCLLHREGCLIRLLASLTASLRIAVAYSLCDSFTLFNYFSLRLTFRTRVQWIAAIVILGLVLAAGGTGYSLPWDARAFFSTRVAEGLMAGLPFVGRNARFWLLGGSDISTLTLSRFFALHVLLIPAFLVIVIVWRIFRSSISALFDHRSAIVAGLVFVALALWSLKYPAPLGPSVSDMTAEYLPRPGAQFLWLYQSLKYIPGGLGSLAGVVLPGIALVAPDFIAVAQSAEVDRRFNTRQRRCSDWIHDNCFISQ